MTRRQENFPPPLSSGKITVEADHRAPQAIKCYTIWDHQLSQLSALPAAGVQALAGFATSICLAAISILATAKELSVFWVGTAWGTGFAAMLLWGWWVRSVLSRRRVVNEIRESSATVGPPALPSPQATASQKHGQADSEP